MPTVLLLFAQKCKNICLYWFHIHLFLFAKFSVVLLVFTLFFPCEIGSEEAKQAQA